MPQHVIYTIFILIKPFRELWCTVDGAGVILVETTPTHQDRNVPSQDKGYQSKERCIDLQ